MRLIFGIAELQFNNTIAIEADQFEISAKATELCKDIEILSQTFERIVDRKDAIIKSLSQDLEEAEEQYQLALR